MNLPLWRIAEFAAKGEVDQELAALGYSIDARALNPGDLFIALSGDRFGPDDTEAALRRGAVAPLIEAGRKIQAAPGPVLFVEDTLRVRDRRARAGPDPGRSRVRQAQFLQTPEHAGGSLARALRVGDAVLLKASRGEAGSVAVKDFGVQHLAGSI